MPAAIRHIHYNPPTRNSRSGSDQGRRYKYFGVPEFIYEALRDAESRGRFECRAVDPPKRRQAIRSAS